MHRSSHPYWKMTSWVTIQLQPDDEIYEGRDKLHLGYEDDPSVVSALPGGGT
jgi:hypothetical protein